jgi:hypothetical protein
MTNSTYTLSTTNRKLSNDYMEINTDDAEAGSILMSLSQQPKSNIKPPSPPPTTTTNTMSIRNLLGKILYIYLFFTLFDDWISILCWNYAGDSDEGVGSSNQYQVSTSDSYDYRI